MPNWCDNYIEIVGGRGASQIKQQLDEHPDGQLFETLIGKKKGEDWYSHNIREYGTKWDIEIGEIILSFPNKGMITMSFASAWSPPLEFCRKLSEKYKVSVECQFFESGVDFSGLYIYNNGEVIQSDDYGYLEGLYIISGSDAIFSEIESAIESEAFESEEEIRSQYSFLKKQDMDKAIKMFRKYKKDGEFEYGGMMDKRPSEYYEERKKYEDALEALEALDSNDEDIKEAIEVLKILLAEPEPSIEDIISEYSYKEGGSVYNDLSIPKNKELIEVMELPNSRVYRYGRGFGKGGRVRFQDKVNAISKRLEGTKVPARLQKDYGKTYNKKESQEAGRRIAGAMMKRERM